MTPIFRYYSWAFLGLGAGIGLLVPVLGAEKAEQITLEQIVKAWRDRQQKVLSFRIRWDERITIAKGSYLNGDKRDRKNPHGLTVPPKTTTYETSYALTMGGNKMRFTRNQLWLTANSELIHQEGTMVSTADGHKTLLQPGSTRYPRGFISDKVVDPTDVDDPTLLPLLLTFRIFHPAVDYFKDFEKRFSMLSGRAVIAGHSCVQIKEATKPPSQPATTIWLDPEHDFMVVRLANTRDNKLMSQVNFTDFHRHDSAWVPMQWKTVMMRGDSVSTSSTAMVREIAINEPIDAREFELEFPAGTWVKDVRRPGEHYILKEGGKKRPIHDTELTGLATYERLRDTEPGEALIKPSLGIWWLRFTLGAIVVSAVLLIALMIARRIWKPMAPGS